MIELVEAIVKKGTPVQANRVQALVSTIFSFAVDAALVKFNPCSRLRKRGAETRDTRVLSDDEIRQFWRRAVLPPITRRVGLVLRLALLTGCRSGEVAGASAAMKFRPSTPPARRRGLSLQSAPRTAGRISFLCPSPRGPPSSRPSN